MDELIVFLRAQLDADEELARVAAALTRSPWTSAGSAVMCGDGLIVTAIEDGESATAEHIARWDPARVLAEVDAKRRIIEAEQDRVIEEGPLPERMRDLIETDVIKLLAQPYAGRDGWREEWRA